MTDIRETLKDLSAKFVGKTVVLLQDEPTGVGYYGEKGMKADIKAISLDIDEEYFEVAMSFGAHREHNKVCEKAVWYGPNDTLLTATDHGSVEDIVNIGVSADEISAFFELADPNPVYDAWRAEGGTAGYVEWLEAVASKALGITNEQPSKDSEDFSM